MPLTDSTDRTLVMPLRILMGRVTLAEWAPLQARWPEVLWMSIPDVVDWYRQEILPRGGDHELQFAGCVLGHIRWGTSQQRCRDMLTCDPPPPPAPPRPVGEPSGLPGGLALVLALDRPEGRVGRPELLRGGRGRIRIPSRFLR